VTELPVRDPIIALDRGAELGWFNMGSTVIVLFGPSGPSLAAALVPGSTIRVGQRLATLR
jgi:phosphatidylserine decarboxylase